MAEPTLKDVLSAISKMEARLGAKIGTEIDSLRTEMTERFDTLDEKVELLRGVLTSTRSDTRDLRDDLTEIHKGLVRVVPKDLPSQVRAKAGKMSRRRADGR